MDFSSVWCDLARWWTGPHCLCAAGGTFLSGVVRSRCFVDMWVAEGHTARLLWPCVCRLVIASRCGCRPASGMSTPSRCRALVHSRRQWSRDRLGHNGCARLCVCGNRGCRTHKGYPRGSGRAGGEGAVRLYFLVYVCRCGDGPLRPEGLCSMATHPSDSWCPRPSPHS